ncbi:MAG: hypothetical protein H8D93_01180 [Verrucomicrobia bacterium]|jgi:hypothetical protein|nr:hypothetical protein [Verrucomicrobiota bacterium]MBL6838969.1 hypothetical protein [Puniceicoccaceae bacterium]
MEFPKDLKRVECPEPVEGLTWVYILLMRNDMLYVGQSKNVSNPSFSAKFLLRPSSEGLFYQ